jgi:hypothetical protein
MWGYISPGQKKKTPNNMMQKAAAYIHTRLQNDWCLEFENPALHPRKVELEYVYHVPHKQASLMNKEISINFEDRVRKKISGSVSSTSTSSKSLKLHVNSHSEGELMNNRLKFKRNTEDDSFVLEHTEKIHRCLLGHTEYGVPKLAVCIEKEICLVFDDWFLFVQQPVYEVSQAYLHACGAYVKNQNGVDMG